MAPPILVFFTSALAGLATIVGIYLVLWNEARVHHALVGLISFAAGVLLTTSFTELLPEAAAASSNAFNIVLVSFFVFYLLEHSLLVHNLESAQEAEPGHHIHHHDTKARASLAIAGLAFHSLIDGVVIGVGFEVSAALGVIAVLAVLLHELPEGVASVSLLLHAGFHRAQAVFWSWVVALATPVGTLVVLALRAQLSADFIGTTLAVAAGSFLYVAAADLIPEIHRELKWRNVAFVALGMLVPVVVESVIG